MLRACVHGWYPAWLGAGRGRDDAVRHVRDDLVDDRDSPGVERAAAARKVRARDGGIVRDAA